MKNFLRKFQIMEPRKSIKKDLSIDSKNYSEEIDKESYIKEDLLIELEIERKNNNKFKVNITINGKIYKNCSRCLEDSIILLDKHKIEHFFEYEEYLKENNHDEKISYYNTNYIDVFPIIRDELLFLMPIYYVCKKDCKGLCTICGNNLNLENCSH